MGAIATASAWYGRNPFWSYDPTRGMLPFHQADHPRRLLRSPNQVGKTIAASWEAWAHLLGDHRWRDRPMSPASGMVMVADLDNAYPVVSAKMRETAPMDALDPATKYVEGKGWYTHGSRYVLAKTGRTIIFRGGEGSPMSAESATVGWLWIDEPPKEDRFGGALSRVAVVGGPVWMDFTPIARPTGWLRRRVEGDPDTGEPPREEWVQIRPRLTEADCTTVGGRVIRSQRSIDAQTASYSPWEIQQRVHGEWEGVAPDRRLVGFSERCVVPARELPKDFDAQAGDELRVGMDHGQLTGKQVLALVLWQRRRAWMLAEAVLPANSGPREVAEGLLRMLASVGLTIHHVSRIVGDANSAGFLGGGAKYNAFVEAELLDLVRLPQLPCGGIDVPNKGRGSVGAGEAAMSHAMRDGRWFVHDTCQKFVSAARSYTGKEEDLKNHVDAARYAVADLLLRAGNAPQGAPLLTL